MHRSTPPGRARSGHASCPARAPQARLDHGHTGRYSVDEKAVTLGALAGRVLRMTNVPFFTVTVDHIPDYLGELKVVEMAADYESGDSPNEALGALKSGAARSGYHGIIGL